MSPVQYLDEAGFLDAHALAVHGVQMTPADLERLAARGTTLVTCPRSNGHTGAGAPPLDARLAADTAFNAAFKDKPEVKSRLETEWDVAAKAAYARAREMAEEAPARIR